MYAIGKQPSKYTSHSFRRGAATYAHIIGISEQDIQTMGGWASSCYKIYIQGTVQDRVRTATKFRNAMAQHKIK